MGFNVQSTPEKGEFQCCGLLIRYFPFTQLTNRKQKEKRENASYLFFTPNMETETIKQVKRETPAYFTLTWLDGSDAGKGRLLFERGWQAASGKQEVRLYQGEPLLPLAVRGKHRSGSDWKQCLVFNPEDSVYSLGLAC